MVVFEMIFGIVVVTTLAGVLNNYLKFKETNRTSLDDMDLRINRLEELEERIKVLETIITDQNYDLDQKIKSL